MQSGRPASFWLASWRWSSISRAGAEVCQSPLANDAEASLGIILLEQRDAVDGEPFETERRKPLPQHRQDRPAPLRIQSSRQRHVEAEFLHHVRVTPAVEIVALPLAELLGPP